jgi:hypothetical protein
MQIKALALSTAVLALAGCASPTAYQPAADNGANGGANGYADQRLAENRYRVTFQGNSATKRETVENYLLLRSAEVTKAAGFAWFAFDDRDTKAKTTYHTEFGEPGFGPGFGWYRHSWRHNPWDPFWGDQAEAVPSTRYQAYAEIIMLTPEQAKSDPHALQASDVIARLGPGAVTAPH